MNGSVGYPMSARVQDTIKVHGFSWSYDYYIKQHDFKAWEFFILAGMPEGLRIEYTPL
jgi:hypothetical protein